MSIHCGITTSYRMVSHGKVGDVVFCGFVVDLNGGRVSGGNGGGCDGGSGGGG